MVKICIIVLIFNNSLFVRSRINEESSNVNRSLENQIENMIDGIIGEDNEESSLHFSEEEEEKAKDFSHIKFERVPKKYPTISFNTQCVQDESNVQCNSNVLKLPFYVLYE